MNPRDDVRRAVLTDLRQTLIDGTARPNGPCMDGVYFPVQRRLAQMYDALNNGLAADIFGALWLAAELRAYPWNRSGEHQ